MYVFTTAHVTKSGKLERRGRGFCEGVQFCGRLSMSSFLSSLRAYGQRRQTFKEGKSRLYRKESCEQQLKALTKVIGAPAVERKILEPRAVHTRISKPTVTK